jgi:hypothetical protein
MLDRKNQFGCTRLATSLDMVNIPVGVDQLTILLF